MINANFRELYKEYMLTPVTAKIIEKKVVIISIFLFFFTAYLYKKVHHMYFLHIYY